MPIYYINQALVILNRTALYDRIGHTLLLLSGSDCTFRIVMIFIDADVFLLFFLFVVGDNLCWDLRCVTCPIKATIAIFFFLSVGRQEPQKQVFFLYPVREKIWGRFRKGTDVQPSDSQFSISKPLLGLPNT